MTADQQPFSPLVAQILTAQADMTHAAVNTVIDNLNEDVIRLRATLAEVRDGVVALIDGDVMPTPRAIERALWPEPEAVAERAQQIRVRGGSA
jgi:endonuclease III